MPELERYELTEGPAYHFATDRRDFLKLAGGGLAIFLALSHTGEAQESGRRGFRGNELPQNIGAWLHIDPNGKITAYTGKVEVGQNARTSLTQAVAEELQVKPEAVQLVMGDTDLTPYDMGTFGSRTTPTMAPQLHKAGAAAREMLIDAAAAKWNVDRGQVSVENGQVRDQNGHSISFGELAGAMQASKTISADVHTTPPSDWKVAGHDLEKVNARDMVTGSHRYTSDLRRPGMLYAKIVRPSAFNAKLVSVDTKAAEQMPGVTVVHEGDYIGVAAEDSAKAANAASAISAEWKADPQPSEKELFTYLKTHPAEAHRGTGSDGDASDSAAKAGDVKVEATYTVAYIAHTPLEPRAAVAEWNSGKLTVWTGTQRPFGVRDELAEAFGMPKDRIRVIVPDTGSGYGGKHTGECAIEAARLAKAAGKPVKLVWTREEELTWAYFRPAGVIDVRSAATKDGIITAWEFHNYNSGPSAMKSYYHIPGEKAEFHETQTPLRQGSYRGLAATANHFARESHMDELAHAVGMEPLAFRLKNTTDPRLRRAYEKAAERFDWGRAKGGSGRGFGIAGGFEKGGYTACCAEVTVANGKIRVERVVQSFDCGAVVNPLHLRNQVEGSVVMGLGGALIETIHFENGRILNARLSRYPVPRFSNLPKIESVLIDDKSIPSAGAGETPIVGIAPAVANAVFNATGQRVRSMPMKL
ncbi:MAG TPA: molybdopterin cofactor-binding domain-containing protein [Bryobacteraceae bacterium]|nr:molybdopterin cofactor-binding domain-containing protein [Bryobacteraceae bacterium]